METVGEVRKSWTLAKRLCGGIRGVSGVEVGPEWFRVWTRGSGGRAGMVEITPGMVSMDRPVIVGGRDFDAAIKQGGARDTFRATNEGEGCRIGAITLTPATDPRAELPEITTVEGPVYKYRGDTVKGVAAFASPDDMRPVLTAVEFRGNTVAATDSYRLGIEGAEDGPEESLLVPAQPLAAIGAAMDWVNISADDREVAVSGVIKATGGFCRYTTAKVEGQFPEWDRIMPDDFRMRATLTDGAADTVKAAEAFAGKDRPLRLTLNGSVEVDAELPDGGKFAPVSVSGSVRPEGDSVLGEATVIGANGTYLRSAIEFAGGSGAAPVLRATAPDKAMLIESGDRRVLVMPIRLT